MKPGEKLIELERRNTISSQSEEFYCDRPWSDVWQATLAMQWLGRPSSMVRQDCDAMQWLELWLRISDEQALTLLSQFERAGYLKRLEQIGRYPRYQVEPSYHEKLYLYLVFSSRSRQTIKEIDLRVFNESYFVTDCNRAWTSMRILCTFTTSQIEICSEIEQSTAEEFVYQLYRIGYLQLVECYDKNLIGSENVYRLCLNSGPIAPLVCADGIVYDTNSRKLYMTQ
ncbi:MAG: hypothetical protein N4J56_007412 [Chroococcidiopsis sp. SAG 2025]|uniref:hypothetical protein n=1 Tax=Chroococcidiopsis sp. SAG 2025 TaxID=171389 RepID=UPI002936F874|nr:hypothetical protein [Chroococcidiopsis sp. SAG 2025]MDV2997707.1 hypothetical protein [Chroococcidiopsis sp. SAG 2025]